MIHVVHILNELLPSGAETMLEVAGPYWAKHGVRCTILATAARRGSFAGRLEAAGYAIHHLPERRSPGYYRDLRNWLAAQQVDAVHLHRESAAVYHILACRKAGRRMVCTHHNSFLFAGLLRLRRIATRRIGRWAGARYIAIGASVHDNEQQRFHNRTEVISNWYDHQRFHPFTASQRSAARTSLMIPDSATVLLSVGNCNELKNHSAFIRALATTAHPSLVYLHVGKEDTAQSERALAAELGVAERIRFLGPRSDIPELLAASDGFVMPSLAEGLGISALEALVSGVPCLLTDTPGLRDFKAEAPHVAWSQPTPEGLAAVLAGWLPRLGELREACTEQAAAVAAVYGVEAGVAGYAAAYHGRPIPGTAL